MKHLCIVTFLLMVVVNLSAQTATEYYRLGNVKRLSGQFDLALDYFKQAILRDSSHAASYCERGYCYASLKNYNEALKAFDKAASLGSQDPLLFLNRGWALYNLGQQDDACRNWQMSEQLGYAQAFTVIEKHCK